VTEFLEVKSPLHLEAKPRTRNALAYYVSKRREPRGEKYGYERVGGEGSRA